MKLIDMTCPNCGSKLKVDLSSKQCTCEYCGTSILIDDEVVHVKYDNAEESGYQFEKGRQRAQREAEMELNGKISSPNNTTQQQSSVSESTNNKAPMWLWVIGWILILPVPATILLLRKKGSWLRYVAIALIWLVYGTIVWGDDSSDKNSTSTNTVATVQSIGATTEAKTKETTVSEIIDTFVKKFNETSDVALEYIEDFTPSDEDSGHYRTEFRLTAYDDALGKSYKFGDTTVDLIARKTNGGDDIIRVYMGPATSEQCIDMVKIASPIMDPDITDDTISEVVEYLKENETANGYYYDDLGLGLIVSHLNKDTYQFMLKLGDD